MGLNPKWEDELRGPSREYSLSSILDGDFWNVIPNMFGDQPKLKVRSQERSVAVALQALWPTVVGKIGISGSVVREPFARKERVDLEKKNTILDVVAPLWRGGWRDRYFKGEMQAKNVKPETHWARRQFLLMRGANADAWGERKNGWTPDEVDTVGEMLVMGIGNIKSGHEQRYVSRVDRGDFSFFHVDRVGNGTTGESDGGENFLLGKRDDPWQSVTNHRDL